MIQKDKIQHIIAGMIISLLTISLFWLIGWETYLMGFGIAMVIGLFKEVLWDLVMGNGKSEWMDWFATILGGLIIDILIHWLII